MPADAGASGASDDAGDSGARADAGDSATTDDAGDSGAVDAGDSGTLDDVGEADDGDDGDDRNAAPALALSLLVTATAAGERGDGSLRRRKVSSTELTIGGER